jgi:hypothetical protein
MIVWGGVMKANYLSVGGCEVGDYSSALKGVVIYLEKALVG